VPTVDDAAYPRDPDPHPTEPVTASDVGEPAGPPRPGSRLERLSHPLALHAIKALAEEYGVCPRPVLLRRTDLATGETDVIGIPCGATRESVCKPCARRAKKLRQQQCREGWHRDDEPLSPPEADEEQKAALRLLADFEYLRAEALANGRWDHVADLDEGIAEVEKLIAVSGIRGTIGGSRTTDDEDGADAPRRKRSTRRRQDAPNLPRKKVTARTVGRTFAGNDGKVYRPSMFITLTLPSYGRVREDGSPVDPSRYDYRRAAWDAVHFPALLDRMFQNLRRVEGWNVQYFGALEPQRRGAPHAHIAIRGAIPRADIRQVLAATYHQVWWPSTAYVHYPEGVAGPVWDDQAPIVDLETGKVVRYGSYVDPVTRLPLPTWDQALDDLDAALDDDPERGPEYVIRFGEQVDIQGVLGGTDHAGRMIGYLTKYITKSVSECHRPETGAAIEHQRRLWEELRFTPCSPRCPNWLRYGIQPEGARDKMAPGYCRSRVHQLDTLGIGGKRVLVSRLWSGKTLADHKWDQAAWVRRVLAVNLDHERGDLDAQVDLAREGGAPAPVSWEMARPGDPDVPDLSRRLLRAISTRIQHRAAIAAAKAADPPDNISATGGHNAPGP
jgi:hypothetical protein